MRSSSPRTAADTRSVSDRLAVLALFCLVLLSSGSLPADAAPGGARPIAPLGVAAPVACPRCWHPGRKVSWQWQLSSRPRRRPCSTSGCTTSTGSRRRGTLVKTMHTAGDQGRLLPERRLVGELAARRRPVPGLGAREVQRLAGGAMARHPKRSRARADHAGAGADRARKGFDAVEFDNVDGYQNATGFPVDRRRTAPLRRLPGERSAPPRLVGAAQERPRPGRTLLPLLRRAR